MTNRELFHATMRHENGNKLLQLEQGVGRELRIKWPEQGMPEHIVWTNRADTTEQENVFDHMNMAGYIFCQFDQYCVPRFEHRIIEDNKEWRTVINGNGVIQKVRPNAVMYSGTNWLPHNIDFTIKSLKAYEENRFRFTGNADLRTNKELIENKAKSYREQKDFMVTLMMHGPFAYLRSIVGVENAMIFPYTEPELVKMMLDDHLHVCMEASEPMIKALKPDMCFVWEDCCGATGPFISPSIFEEMMAPWYRAWKEYLVSMGVPWIMLDTDGDPSPLVRLWYENGVDCMQPWEVNAVDMLKFAEEYPQYVMMGGIYKHMFQPDDISQAGKFKTNDVHKCVDDELERVVKPMVKRGGYIASLDHGIDSYVNYHDFKYYCRQLTEKYGKANVSTRF